MSFLFLFFDGVGIGKKDAAINPFAHTPSKFFTHFLDEENPVAYDGRIIPTDANLDVPGLPQSATGQTALFTGQNASKVVGEHISGFPTKPLRELIKTSNILKDLTERGKDVKFINAYSTKYFERREIWYSATTWLVISAGLDFLMLDDLRNGNAVFHDFTHRSLQKLGYDVSLRTPAESGRNLARLVEKYDLCLYEHILTDKYGHQQDMKIAVDHLQNIDQFLDHILANIDLTKHTVLLSSDHGNFEDLSTGRHTRNPVPTILWGKTAAQLAPQIQTILSITPAILSLPNVA